MLIKEIKDLICPKDNLIEPQAFMARAELVCEVLHAVGATEVSELWKSYMSKSERWASHSHYAIIQRIFPGTREIRLPMLARSNNPVEAFFSVLKYHVSYWMENACAR